jgi:hypothetical protein
MGAMSKVKKKDGHIDWSAYELTPEQKAQARAEAEERARKAAESGVYERLMELRGKVKWDLDLDELREDRD